MNEWNCTRRLMPARRLAPAACCMAHLRKWLECDRLCESSLQTRVSGVVLIPSPSATSLNTTQQTICGSDFRSKDTTQNPRSNTKQNSSQLAGLCTSLARGRLVLGSSRRTHKHTVVSHGLVVVGSVLSEISKPVVTRIGEQHRSALKPRAVPRAAMITNMLCVTYTHSKRPRRPTVHTHTSCSAVDRPS